MVWRCWIPGAIGGIAGAIVAVQLDTDLPLGPDNYSTDVRHTSYVQGRLTYLELCCGATPPNMHHVTRRGSPSFQRYKARSSPSLSTEVDAHSSQSAASGFSSPPTVLGIPQFDLQHALHLVFPHRGRTVCPPLLCRHAHKGEKVRDRSQREKRCRCRTFHQVATDELARDSRATRDAQESSL